MIGNIASNFPSLKRLAGMKIASTYFTNSNMNCNMNSNINMYALVIIIVAPWCSG